MFFKNIQNGGHKQCEGYVTLKEKNIQNGGHKQCEGYVTLKEKKTFKMVGISSVKAM